MRKWRWGVWLAVAAVLMLNNPNIARRGPLVVPQAGVADAFLRLPLDQIQGPINRVGPPGQQIDNPYRLRVYLSSATVSMPADGAFRIVPFDTIGGPQMSAAIGDPLKGWNPSTFQWTVPLTGVYQVNSVEQLLVTDATFYLVKLQAQLFVNNNTGGVAATPGIFQVYGVHTATDKLFGPSFSAILADQVFLNKGDLIDIRFAHVNDLATALFLTGVGSSYFSVQLVSRV